MIDNKFKKRRVTDFKNSECAGCGLCATLCPKQCISMGVDSLGFSKPVINDEICIDCGLCAQQCIVEHPLLTTHPIATFAAVRSESEKINFSSSGGVFAAIAEHLLSEGWMIAGCVLDSQLHPRHILTTDEKEVRRMYGSKYVQSDTSGIYKSVKEALKGGHKVLFSGTPCQIAAIKRFTKNHDNLLTIEVICHGVPNVEMFHSSLEQYKKKPIKDFIFRDKGQGWTFNNRIVYEDGSVKKVNHRLSSYMTYFLEGETYRDSCYHCPYAKPERAADITLGDFWGIVGERADLKEHIDIEKGVSCLIVNTNKGLQTVHAASINKFEVQYDEIKAGNEPLNHPSSTHTDKRDQILALWQKKHQWMDVEKYWRNHDYKFSYLIWSMIPTSLQHKIRLLLGKR